MELSISLAGHDPNQCHNGTLNHPVNLLSAQEEIAVDSQVTRGFFNGAVPGVGDTHVSSQ